MINPVEVATKIAGDFYREREKVAATIVDVVDMGAKPVTMPPAVKRRAQEAVMKAVKDTYYFSIPLQDIMNELAQFGILVIQEDGTEWSGFLTGASGRASFELGWEGRRIRNVALQMTWYKMPSGKYEIVAYLA